MKPMVARADVRRIALYFFLVTSSFGFLQPFVPLYLEAAGLSRAEIGWIAGLGTGLALVVQPILGRWSDRVDSRRPFIFASALTACLAYFAFQYAHGFFAFLGLVAVGTNGTMYLNAAGGVLVGRLVTAEQGGAAYAGLRLWGSIGYIVTSIASGILVGRYTGINMDRDALDVVFRFGPFLFIGLAALAFWLPDVRSASQTARPRERAPLTPNLRYFLIAYFFYTLALYGASSFLSLYLKSLGAKGLGITGVFAAGVFVEVLVMRWVGRFSDRFGRRPALALTFVLLPLRLLLYIPATGPLWVLVVQSLHGLNFGIMGAISVVFVNDLATDRTRGHAQSRLFAVAGLATAVGPLILGLAAELSTLGLMFGVAAAFATVGAVIFVLFVRDSRENSESIAECAPMGLRALLGWLDHPLRS